MVEQNQAPGACPDVFINYRRADTRADAGRLCDFLVEQFGEPHVFFDIDGLSPGVDFVDAIDAWIHRTDVLLVMIGPVWSTVVENGKRRIEDPNDHVRVEIETALAKGRHIIPVLVGGAEMPEETDVPESLLPLTRRNAIRLPDQHWRSAALDLAKAIQQLSGKVGAAVVPTAAPTTASTPTVPTPMTAPLAPPPPLLRPAPKRRPRFEIPDGAPVPYAHWWKRCVSLIIDYFVTAFVVGGVSGATNGSSAGAVVGLVVAGAILVFTNARGTSPGKKILKLHLCGATTHQPIGFGLALVRLLLACVLAFTVIDSFWPLWDKRRQTLHDKAAHTVVLSG